MEMDLTSSVEPRLAFNVQEITSDTTTVGNIIDTVSFQSVDLSFFTGTVTDGDYAVTINVGDEVDDIANPTSITDAAPISIDNLIGSLPAFTDNADDDAIKHVGIVAKKRFFQVSVVSTNTSSGAFVGAQATLGNASSRPTS